MLAVLLFACRASDPASPAGPTPQLEFDVRGDGVCARATGELWCRGDRAVDWAGRGGPIAALFGDDPSVSSRRDPPAPRRWAAGLRQ